MFDLAKLSTELADEGATLELRHPQTEEVIPGAVITLLGEDSKVYRKLEKDRLQSALNRMSKGKKADALQADKAIEDELEKLVSLTKGWTLPPMNGEPITFSADAARKLYSNPGLRWIRDQVSAFISERANFFR